MVFMAAALHSTIARWTPSLHLLSEWKQWLGPQGYARVVYAVPVDNVAIGDSHVDNNNAEDTE